MPESKGYIRTSDERGSINICQSVVAVIAATAVIEISGVYGLYQSPGKELITLAGKKGLTKGVRVNVEEDDISVDVYIITEMGFSVNEIGIKVQKAVIAAIEEAVGIDVNTVNVHICGVSLKKAKQPV